MFISFNGVATNGTRKLSLYDIPVVYGLSSISMITRTKRSAEL